MTGTIEWLHAENDTSLSQEAAAAPSLQDLQDYVGGYIEVVNVLVDDEPCQMIVNEEGLVQHLKVNVRASKHYATYALKEMRCFPPTPICGNAVLLRGIFLD